MHLGLTPGHTPRGRAPQPWWLTPTELAHPQQILFYKVSAYSTVKLQAYPAEAGVLESDFWGPREPIPWYIYIYIYIYIYSYS